MRKKAPKGWVKISDFEKLTGISNKTITAAIKRGAVPPTCVDRVGSTATAPYYLHPLKSAIAWRSTLNANHPLARPVRDALEKYIRKVDPSAIEAEAEPTEDSGQKRKLTYAEAQLQEQVAKARLRELELEEKEGSLVQRAIVNDQLFAFGQELRNALLAIPDRVIDQIIAESGTRAKAHATLYEAIASELEKLTDIDNQLS